MHGLPRRIGRAGVAAFERGNWTQSYAKHVCPRLSPKAKMKILFLLHALLKEIQECLSYQSQEFSKSAALPPLPISTFPSLVPSLVVSSET